MTKREGASISSFAWYGSGADRSSRRHIIDITFTYENEDTAACGAFMAFQLRHNEENSFRAVINAENYAWMANVYFRSLKLYQEPLLTFIQNKHFTDTCHREFGDPEAEAEATKKLRTAMSDYFTELSWTEKILKLRPLAGE
jgi:hypothetical protein